MPKKSNSGTRMSASPGLREKNRKVYEKYTKSLSKETDKMSAAAIAAMGAASSRQSQSVAVEKIFREYDRVREDLITQMGDEVAETVTKNTNAENARKANRSFKDIGETYALDPKTIPLPVQEQLRVSVESNARLITNLTNTQYEEVQGIIYRSMQSGADLKEMQTEIENLLGPQNAKTMRRARLIANDQTKKGYAALTSARMKSTGIEKFKWVHSGGGGPRAYHKARAPGGLNGGIYSVDDPPIIDRKTGERGLPGQLINCKCQMIPVVEFE